MFLKLRKNFLRSISFRLTLGYAVLFVISSFLILFLNYFLFSQSIQARDHEILFAKAKEYSSIYAKGGVSELNHYLAEEKQSDEDSQYLVRIESDKGESLLLHRPEKMQQISVDELNQKISAIGYSKNILNFSIKERTADDPDEVNEYEVASQLGPQGEHIQVARNSDDRDDLIERYLKTFLGVAFAVLVIGSLGGFIFSIQALAPLRRLIQTMKRVRSGELSARIPARNSNDELDEISLLFNRMAEKIEKLISNMRETLDTVAHDLKTPLTRLKAKAELTLLSPSSLSDYKNTLESGVENISEIVSLIDTIMDISEAEVGLLKLDLLELHSARLIMEVIDLYSILAEEKNILIQFKQTSDFKFKGDKNRFKQVFSNLLDNAIKYSPKNSTISIESRLVGQQGEISMIDQGVGISSQDLSKIWDRLFRVPNQTEKGLGLGLSLVRSICKAHGWKIEVQSHLDHGSEFKLTMTTS